VNILSRYIFIRTSGPLLVILTLLCGTIFALQAIRLGHHVMGAGISGWVVLRMLLYSLPTLLVFSLPLALAAAILFALGRLAESGQILAMRTAGISCLGLARPLAWLVLISALLCWLLVARLEPASMRSLYTLLGRTAARVLVLGAAPGRFHRLVDGATLYVQQRLQGEGRFAGLLLAAAAPGQRALNSVLLAREAQVRQVGDLSVLLDLHHGELQQRHPDEGLRRVQFGRLQYTMDLKPALERHLGFLARRAAMGGQHPQEAALACLALGLLAAAIGLGGGGRGRQALLGLLGVAAYQAAAWGIGLMESGPLGSVLLAGGVASGALLSLTLRR